MAGKDPKKRKKSNQEAPRELTERRFAPAKARMHVATAVVGMVGAAALGAGVWGRFFMDPPAPQWYLLLVPGAAAFAGALFWGEQSEAVRVGDAGVGLERSAEVARLPWCDMKRIHIAGNTLTLEGADQVLSISMGAHGLAAAWVLAEAMKRVPDAVDVKRSAADDLPKPSEKDGEVLRVEDYQVAGRHCAASDLPIAFERDARLCPRCGQVYHRAHVPERCLTCEAKLAGRAIRPPV